MVNLQLDPSHASFCPKFQGDRIRRHDQLVHIIARYAEVVGIAATVEPTGQQLGLRHQNRPDLKLYLSDGVKYADVVVTDPLAPANAQYALAHLGSGDHAALKKTEKWTRLMPRDVKFVPLAFEATGGFTKQVQDLIKTISRAAGDMGMYTRQELHKRLTSALAVSIQRSNAEAIMRVFQRCRQ